MTTNELIGTVLLRVSGGVATSDVAVREWDIRSIIPAVINYVITGDYWANIQRDNDREIPNSFVSEFTIPIEGDRVEFDKKVVNIPGNGGIRYVMDDCGNSYAPRALGVSKKCYWDKVLGVNKEYQFKDGEIRLFGNPPLLKSVVVGAVMDASEMDPDDELPIPAEKGPEVVDMLVGFFTNQRLQPKDYIINRIDPVNEVR